MSNQPIEPATTPGMNSEWGVNLEAAICEHCDWRYLLPPGLLPLYCPHCFKAVLTSVEGQADSLAHSHPPELILPFTVSVETLGHSIQDFAGKIWFAPGDLNPQNLKSRLQRIYLPMWLVDRQVQATWQAEAGYNYEVVSHQDSFDESRGGWHSRQVTETRIRWEPRVGRLQRTYHNIPAPALDEHGQLMRQLGLYSFEAGQPYQPRAMEQVMVHLPNRSPADAWPDAIPALQNAAARECQQATSADHMREFRWAATYLEQNWTLLLLPVYVTYYLDDDRNPQPILIHGQTGHLSGPRRASMRRAQRAAFTIAGGAVIIFTLSLIIALISFLAPSILFVAGLGLIVAIIIGLLAIAPLVIVWQFNQSNR
jgi:hypothetical protein